VTLTPSQGNAPASQGSAPAPRSRAVGFSILAAALAVVVGLVGVVLSLWPIAGLPVLGAAVLLSIGGFALARRARRQAKARGLRTWPAIVALVLNGIAALPLLASLLAGGLVYVALRTAPLAGAPPSRPVETPWLDRSDSSGTITGRTVVAMGIGFAAIIALAAADDAGWIDLGDGVADPTCTGDDDCTAPAYAVCDVDAGTCNPCEHDADCAHQGAAHCERHVCRGAPAP
jgi:hypothetical protein